MSPSATKRQKEDTFFSFVVFLFFAAADFLGISVPLLVESSPVERISSPTSSIGYIDIVIAQTESAQIDEIIELDGIIVGTIDGEKSDQR